MVLPGIRDVRRGGGATGRPRNPTLDLPESGLSCLPGIPPSARTDMGPRACLSIRRVASSPARRCGEENGPGTLRPAAGAGSRTPCGSVHQVQARARGGPMRAIARDPPVPGCSVEHFRQCSTPAPELPLESSQVRRSPVERLSAQPLRWPRLAGSTVPSQPPSKLGARTPQPRHRLRAEERCIRPTPRAVRTSGRPPHQRRLATGDPARRSRPAPGEPTPGRSAPAGPPPASEKHSAAHSPREAPESPRASVGPQPDPGVRHRLPCRPDEEASRTEAEPQRRSLGRAAAAARGGQGRGSRAGAPQPGLLRGMNWQRGSRLHRRCGAPTVRQPPGAMTM